MMEDNDSDDAISLALGDGPHSKAPRSGGFLQMPHKSSSHASGMDAYMQESEDGLSAALGPRWNARDLNENAERSTKALLKGIGGGKAMRSLNGMMGAMLSLR